MIVTQGMSVSLYPYTVKLSFYGHNIAPPSSKAVNRTTAQIASADRISVVVGLYADCFRILFKVDFNIVSPPKNGYTGSAVSLNDL